MHIITLPTKHYSGEQIEKSEMGGVCSTYGGEEWAYRVLVGKAEGKRPLGRLRNIKEDNIKDES